ncbi:hypothetical protein GCM10023151_04010 [Kangiella marina]|uniref:Low-complexity protein n=2 Tax=Kangiella marina TaxID=1079178 RepID=A0ABP8ID38_9GAMM
MSQKKRNLDEIRKICNKFRYGKSKFLNNLTKVSNLGVSSMLNKDKKKLAMIVGASIAASAAMGTAAASDNPFALNDLQAGYDLAKFDAGEGKCGEGKCGEDKAEKEGKCGEGKCGEDKAEKEGKCGEGKCGEGKAEKEGKCGEGKCGEDKAEKEGKCGEGKCGVA